MRRVVVTGVGAITPLGIGAAAYWERSKAGCSGIRHIENFDPSNLPVQIAGEVPGFAHGLAFINQRLNFGLEHFLFDFAEDAED